MPEPDDQLRRYAEAAEAEVPAVALDRVRAGARRSRPWPRPVLAAAAAVVVLALAGVAVATLSSDGDEPVATGAGSTSQPGADGDPEPGDDPGPSGEPGALPHGLARCHPEPPRITAPEERYRDRPVYVGNEMPHEAVRAWAQDKPGYVDLWIDRDRNGWITVAFTEDAEARQAELEAAFPDDGVVAVEVDWTVADLEDLRTQVTAALAGVGAHPLESSIAIDRGVLGVNVGELTEERLAALAPLAGPRLCIDGVDSSQVIPDGPPTPAGDGWRLLGWDLTGPSYRTGIATNPDQYVALWAAAGLPGDPAPVDLDAEVVIWFGSVYGSGCETRLDDVVIDTDRALVHGSFVLPGVPRGCNSDARPKAYLVAVERDHLPAGPFAIQLTAEDPPRGVPEERTVVSADLREPGSVATTEQIGPDPDLVGG